MREAVIVSTARTPIGKAYRGAFNDTTDRLRSLVMRSAMQFRGQKLIPVKLKM